MSTYDRDVEMIDFVLMSETINGNFLLFLLK
jgi:hypothetical protein